MNFLWVVDLLDGRTFVFPAAGAPTRDDAMQVVRKRAPRGRVVCVAEMHDGILDTVTRTN